MKTKQEQIEETKNELLAHTPVIDIQFETFNEVAEAIYNIGYRKAREVIEDFVKKLIDFPHWLENGTVLVIHMEELLELAAEMRQEVEK